MPEGGGKDWPFVVGPLFCEEGLTEQERKLIGRGRDEQLCSQAPVVVTGTGMERRPPVRK